MSSVSVRDSRKDLISVDSEKSDPSQAGSNGGEDSGDMTTFNRSRSNRMLSAALALSLILCVGLLIGLIVVSTNTPQSPPADKPSGAGEAIIAAPATEELCLTEGCIGIIQFLI